MNKTQYLNWQTEQQIQGQLLPNLCAWFLYPGSFMTRLQEHGIPNPSINVVGENWQLPLPYEAELLKLDSQSQVLVREVLIESAGYRWMFARSIFPKQTLTGREYQLANLKNRSLGSVLFNDPDMQRSHFEMTCLMPGVYLYEKAIKLIDTSTEKLWARRSVFDLRGKELLLTEVFLPDIEKLC